MNFANIVRTSRERLGLTQEELAIKLDVSRPAVGSWESGKAKPRLDKLTQLANLFGMQVSELIDEDGNVATIPFRGTSAMVPMRILGKTHAGTPTEEIEDIKLVEVPETVARNHPDAFMLQVEGDCMNRSYPDGCLVMVDPTVSPWNGCAVVAEPGVGESVLRRYMRGQSSMMLAADSFSAYDDMVFSGEDEVKLVGVVVWYQAACEEAEK